MKQQEEAEPVPEQTEECMLTEIRSDVLQKFRRERGSREDRIREGSRPIDRITLCGRIAVVERNGRIVTDIYAGDQGSNFLKGMLLLAYRGESEAARGVLQR